MKKYLQLYGIFIKNCVLAASQYRANFIMGMLVETAFLVVKASYALIVYKIGIEINGLTPDAILLFIGTYTLMTGFMMSLFFFNFTKIPEYVRNGDFDLLITKPISLQFYATLRYIDISTPIPNLAGGIGMIIIAWSRLQLAIDSRIIVYILMMAGGILLTYSILLIPTLISFWAVKNQAVQDITYALWDFNNMPMAIYSKWIQRVGLMIIPILVVTNFPCMYVLNRLNRFQCIWTFAVPVIVFFFARILWRKAMRQYTSASS